MNLAAFLAERRAHFETADSVPDEHMPGFLRQHLALLTRLPFVVTNDDARAAEEEIARAAWGFPMGGDDFDASLRRRLDAYRRAAS